MMRKPISGVVIGKVTNNKDPKGLGRIEVMFPWLAKDAPRRWAPVASIMAGGDSGAFFMPEKDDEVLLAFDQGDWDHAYVIGFLWNPKQKPPSRDERQRMIRSKNGHTIRFVDSTPVKGTKGALIVADGHGNVVTMTSGMMSIHSEGTLSITGKTVAINGRVFRPIPGPI
ncbi:MAG: hypothetical protein GY788_05355 [bacterium]|nr:hypothetical protein [bacterium]